MVFWKKWQSRLVWPQSLNGGRREKEEKSEWADNGDFELINFAMDRGRETVRQKLCSGQQEHKRNSYTIITREQRNPDQWPRVRQNRRECKMNSIWLMSIDFRTITTRSRQRADVMFAVTTSADVFKAILIFILPVKGVS